MPPNHYLIEKTQKLINGLKFKIISITQPSVDKHNIQSKISETDLSDCDFTHLHNHSQFSILQSTIKIKDLVDKASEMKMKAVAITDLGNMMGAFRFVDAVKKKNKQNLTP